jgi:hypothetical protein
LPPSSQPMKLTLTCLLMACLSAIATPLTLRWNAAGPADSVTSYEVYGSTNQLQWTLLVTTPNTTATPNLPAGVWHFYVAGVNYWGKSPVGTVVTSLPPVRPFRLGITGIESPLPVKVQVTLP